MVHDMCDLSIIMCSMFYDFICRSAGIEMIKVCNAGILFLLLRRIVSKTSHYIIIFLTLGIKDPEAFGKN